jgi:subtilase family serine protease
VGGTDLQVTKPGGPWSSETGWRDSGGGFSQDNNPIPAWQQLTGVINSSNKGSKTLRNIPDVAGEANFDFYVCADQTTCVGGYGGTSFAAPMWAGYLALVNQQAVANGNPPLGFINPAVYNIGVGSGYGAAFHDITSGSNGGFTAVTGYDLVTGWGSPNGSGLITALTGPAGPSFSLTASPNTLSIQQGASGTSTITVVPAGGFTGSVTLSATGLPTGVTAAFNPNPTTTTSTLTLTASASATTGTSTVTINGTSGSLTGSTTLTLTVTTKGGTPAVTLTPTSLTWGKVFVGTTKGPKVVTLTNSGTATLNISGLAVSGDFALVTGAKPCGGALAVGKACKIRVTFTPTAVGTRTGDVTITDNAPNSPQQVPLTGTGK